MASVIGPPNEMLSISVSPISPLYFPDSLAAAISEVARLGVPFMPLPAPNAGATAPMSLAGALTLQNAEVLAAIVLVQVIHPGLPVVYCGRLSILEPRSGGASWGVPALGLAAAACVQIGHSYHLPVNVYGLSTDSNQPDMQNGYERALNAILPALAGADELSGIGNLGAGIISSYAQMVCDNDIVLSIKQVCKGFAVNENSLAVELVDEVLHTSGNFLAERHTVKTLRSGEVYFPVLADRRHYDEWERAGRDGMLERARAKAEMLLAEHEVPPLSPEQERELDNIMHAAEKELRG
jgi:trimethylamine--corrinoid protein Co-methyltransferase